MGLFKKLLGKRRFGGEEEAVIKELEFAETEKEGGIGDLEKQWLERRNGAAGGEEKEELEKRAKELLGEREAEKKEGSEAEEQKEEEGVSINEDELISSLREVDEKEEEEEMDLVLKKVMEEMGNVRAKEILSLGREVLSDMRGGGR